MDGLAKRRSIVTNVGARDEIVVWIQITEKGLPLSASDPSIGAHSWQSLPSKAGRMYSATKTGRSSLSSC
jgi:hypothetical protein